LNGENRVIPRRLPNEKCIVALGGVVLFRWLLLDRLFLLLFRAICERFADRSQHLIIRLQHLVLTARLG